jgi:hypothetical protein
MKKVLLLSIVVIIIRVNLHAQSKDIIKRSYNASRVIGTPPVIDGNAKDSAWSLTSWEEDFIQRTPYENAQPSQKTAFKILYDDNNIYVLIRAYDSIPEKIDKRLSRRDDQQGDLVSIQFDSYNDKLTAFEFQVSAGGVKSDGEFINDGETEDMTWDPIWFVKTSIDKEGWIAEMKIPLSQLRFGKSEEQLWGLEVLRYIQRKEEFSTWQQIPMNSSGWVHGFGELHGIKDIKPKKQIEIQPYGLAKYETYKKEDGNPFMPGTKASYALGLDGKIGITNDLTLDYTINPDFGQVEADPSVVNLTGFETYYVDKRPFFIEGNNILSFQLTPGNNGFSSDNLFYSRRIGRPPHLYPEGYDYVDMPGNTAILGAFKLTGKTKQGLSVGVMESMTQKEFATTDLAGEKGKQIVEPFTNYCVGRVQQDFNKGTTRIGAMLTATNRDLSNAELKILHQAAYTGGLDFNHNWKDRTYNLSCKFLFSDVLGSKQAITNTQLSSVHYFQRTDAGYFKLDTNRTNLMGQGGIIQFGRSGNSHWSYTTWLNWRSPGLELNDVGYLKSADDIFQVIWAQYNQTEPFGIFRQACVNWNQWTGWDFGGNNTYSGGNTSVNGEFKNYWYFGFGANIDGNNHSNSMLRGGPTMRTPGDYNYWLSLNTDGRKKIILGASYTHVSGFLNWMSDNNYGLSIVYRASDVFKFTLSPNYDLTKSQLQYVTTANYNSNPKYILASLEQNTLNFSFRLDYCITPNLTLQYFGQPFISSGKYSNFKNVTNSKADAYNNRFHTFGSDEISYDGNSTQYNIDENKDGTTDYSFADPNFKVLDFISNLVLRWEYTPGSTLFLVWSQNRSGFNPNGRFAPGKDMNDLFAVYPSNVFLIKFSYRFRV